MNNYWAYIESILELVVDFFIKYFWLIVVAFVALKFLFRKSANKKMPEIAQKLGLQFEKRSSKKQIEDSTPSTLQEQTTELPKVLNYLARAIDFAIPLVSPWEMKGKWNDVPVCVYPDVSEQKGRLTRVRADREDAKTIGLSITAAAILNRVLGSNDITSGNEELDKMVFISARDSDQAKMLLMNPYLQDAILQAFQFNNSINIEDQHVSFFFRGVLSDEQKLRAALDHVSRIAIALRSASR